MKCPLIFSGVVSQVAKIRITSTDCLKEDCAWWNSKPGLCLIATLALEIKLLSETMTLMLAKMPHEGQFRRGQQ